MKRLDVGVVGAGPAGLASALFLHRAGHRITLLERFDAPEPVGSGLLLQPTGLTVLDRLGLLQAILPLGNRIDRLEGRDARSKRLVLDVGYGALPGGRFGLAVHRSVLFGVLMEAVRDAGIAVETGWEIEDLDVGARIAPKGVAGRSPGAFDLLVDASGARSRLKRFSARPAEPKPLSYGALWTTLDFPASGFDARALTQRYHEARVMIGVLPLGRPFAGEGEKAAFFWSVKPAEVPALHAAGIERWRDEVSGYWPETAGMLGEIASFDRLTLARYGHHTLGLPIGPRIAFIGDAAHSTSPQLGQGANMALLDAATLGHCLSQAEDIEAGLRAYARARRRHVRLFQLLSYWLTPFYQSDSVATARLRDLLVGGVGRIAPAQRIMAAMVSGTLVDPFAGAGLRESDWRSLGPMAGVASRSGTAGPAP